MSGEAEGAAVDETGWRRDRRRPAGGGACGQVIELRRRFDPGSRPGHCQWRSRLPCSTSRPAQAEQVRHPAVPQAPRSTQGTQQYIRYQVVRRIPSRSPGTKLSPHLARRLQQVSRPARRGHGRWWWQRGPRWRLRGSRNSRAGSSMSSSSQGGWALATMQGRPHLPGSRG